MNDDAALLAAILANPDEDTPRLAYADWLDEYGDAAARDRAEFIRLQIELARGGLTGRQRKTVEGRCAALEKQHREVWLAPCREAWLESPLIAATFRRGFVSDISGRLELPDRFAAIAAVCPVQRVDIECSWAGNVPGAEAMAACPALSRVRWMDCRRYPMQFGSAVLASPHLTGLHTLYLQWGWLEGGVELVSRSPVAANLRHLWVWGSTQGAITPGRGLGTIVSAEWPALTQVRLDNLAVRESGTLEVVRAGVARRWHAVHVSEVHLNYAAVTTAIQIALEGQLRSLSLAGGCSLKEPPRPEPDDARLLCLNMFPDFGNVLVGWVMTNVPPQRFNRIALRNSLINSATVSRLAQWPGLAGVTELDLRGNRFGDLGALALAESPYLENVSLLLVAHNDITKKGKDALKKRFARRVRVAE